MGVMLMFNKINDFGGAVQDASRSNKEDERSAALAARARLGDYDEGLSCNDMFYRSTKPVLTKA